MNDGSINIDTWVLQDERMILFYIYPRPLFGSITSSYLIDVLKYTYLIGVLRVFILKKKKKGKNCSTLLHAPK